MSAPAEAGLGQADTPVDLLDLTRAGIEALVEGWGYKAFHGRNLFKWIHKHGLTDFEAMTDLSKRLRLRLAAACTVGAPRVVLEQPAPDGTVKWLTEVGDGQRIETVFIPEAGRRTLCISSQVGCALGCAFCATGQQGFARNLSLAEIIGQVWHVTRYLGVPPSNVVLMGMGEPLANFDAAVAAMEILQDDFAYMLSKYRVTLSTSGIVPNIYRLGTVSDVALAVSLHAPNNALRDELVPINRKYPLEVLLPACKTYLRGDRRRRITWEYVMLDGVNDGMKEAKQLIRLLEGIPSKINLIPFNPFPGGRFAASPPERVEAFRQRLLRSGLMTTTRKTRGDAIAAACGQLVGQVQRHRTPPARTAAVAVGAEGMGP
ncbi:23S rRNA m2A2503 methyltransferase [Thioflavicoccus mobilis 8321]|uniref:Dual-specificity RNA methyltransferase RlmN n=1 Tax=Thioflavicoccus mobilis 8321 TaxID=765912 RepID=L0GZC4_9GAMM|nr:bifunctional tRNA (adenosine(37)-C2)-methyltransferase TrmG/ribosomal RNA large subunit methyltransferase RlmN [Thioflavicoccus mobilis]AGA90659.1 23S rRNA m2A2503 methyltransferase [Thioflavicoccus mobilis 8321]